MCRIVLFIRRSLNKSLPKLTKVQQQLSSVETNLSITRSAPLQRAVTESGSSASWGVTKSVSSASRGVTKSVSSASRGVTKSGSSASWGVTESGWSASRVVTESCDR
eukprot:35425-Prorocentrum_minimum.AAC.1